MSEIDNIENVPTIPELVKSPTRGKLRQQAQQQQQQQQLQQQQQPIQQQQQPIPVAQFNFLPLNPQDSSLRTPVVVSAASAAPSVVVAQSPTPTARAKHKSKSGMTTSPLREKNFQSPVLTSRMLDEAALEYSQRPTKETVTYNDYLRMERQYADSVIMGKELIHEKERSSQEIREKGKQVEAKTLRINELLQENTSLMKQLRHERELNEQEFNSWSDLKAQLEAKVHRLSQTLQTTQEDCESLEMQRSNSLHQYNENVEKNRVEIAKLEKRIMVLAKENELEVHSKMMIIDELEMFKEKASELEAKYQELKVDYDALLGEFGSSIEEEDKDSAATAAATSADADSTNNDTVSSSTAAAAAAAAADTNVDTTTFSDDLENELQQLEVEKRGSRSASSRVSSSSTRQSSLHKFIKEVELQAQEHKHSQEIIKLNFQIRSLELENEKLHSYIGFVLQQLNGDPQAGDAFEYSDEANIKSARESLKTVIRSKSAYPIRPTDRVPSRHPSLNMRPRTGDGFVGAASSSLPLSDSSSDYEGDQVELVDIGDTDFSFADGEDEDAAEEDDMTRYNDSLNVSFQMDLIPSFGLKKRKQSKLFKRTPRKHLEKLTSFSLSSKSSMRSLNPQASTLSLRQQGSAMSLRQRLSTPSLRPQSSNLSLRPQGSALNLRQQASIHSLRKSASNMVLRNRSSNLDLINELDLDMPSSEFYPLAEEDEEEALKEIRKDLKAEEVAAAAAIASKNAPDRAVEVDVDDDDDDDEEEESEFDEDGSDDNTLHVSNEEVDRFKIVVLRKLFCPRHMMFQCFCRQRELLNPFLYYDAINPVAARRRKCRKVHDDAYDADSESGGSTLLDESDVNVVD